MHRGNVYERYFDWLCDLICKDRFANQNSFYRLLSYLYDTEFRYSMSRDSNRAEDGIDLRRRFLYDYVDDVDMTIEHPCSVLEMMVALAIRCEECIMDDADKGDRTGQWFWTMITNLGLGSMTDDRFDERCVDDVIERFLNREYEPNGRGGLFYIRNCDQDLRSVEIWYQLCWYLNSITNTII